MRIRGQIRRLSRRRPGVSWLDENWRWVDEFLRVHLFITLPATALAVLMSVPIGRFAHRFPKVSDVILSSTTLTYTIPSLPPPVTVPLVIGTPLRSLLTITAAPGLYGMALLVRATSDAFSSVDQTVIDGATAVGHSRRTLLWTAEFPLAVSVLVLRIRAIAVSTVGLMMIRALVGIPSVGMLLTDGFQRGIVAEVVTGVVATIALTPAVNRLVILLDRPLTPWTRAGKAPSAKGEQA